MNNHNEKLKMNLKDRSFRYSVKIIRFLDILPRDVSTKVISDQLLRSATSIGANIIEAQASSSKRDFANFFHHSLKSANESLYWLKLLKDAKRIINPEMEYLLGETDELARILASSLLTIKGKNRF